jgi:hypothetical protein
MEWLYFVRERCAELMYYAFTPERLLLNAGHSKQTIISNRITYKFYSRELNKLGFGSDFQEHPNLQAPNYGTQPEPIILYFTVFGQLPSTNKILPIIYKRKRSC